MGVDDIHITVQRPAAHLLQLSYQVLGKLSELRIPAISAPQRCDELWRHTCAELFVTVPDAELYHEFNFSPSAHWAAYEFTAYRQDMRAADCAAPLIEVMQAERQLLIKVQVRLPVQLVTHQHLQLGFSMVIETMMNQCAYWALTHSTDHPDFHRRDNFIMTI